MQSATPPDYKTLYGQSQLRIIALEQQLQQLQKMIFGSRHERFVPATSNDPQLSWIYKPNQSEPALLPIRRESLIPGTR
jgi:hypothetical protein